MTLFNTKCVKILIDGIIDHKRQLDCTNRNVDFNERERVTLIIPSITVHIHSHTYGTCSTGCTIHVQQDVQYMFNRMYNTCSTGCTIHVQQDVHVHVYWNVQ